MKNFFSNRRRQAGFIATATALTLNACAPSQETPAPSLGVNVSRYLAVGDSYTAGISAGGLTRNSQEYSYPNLLANQFQAASADATFSQPLVEAGTGTGYLNFVDFSRFGFARSRRVAGQAVRRTVINPTACNGPDTLSLFTRSATAGTLPQNLGVPGLALSQIETVGLGNDARATPGAVFNPYFERLLPAGDNRTYLQTVSTAASTATFFTFFQGLDDLMPYIRSGGTCGSRPTTTFANQMKANAKKLLDVLTAGGRKGIIIRIPDITLLPLLRQGKGTDVQARLQAANNDNTLIYIEDPVNFGSTRPISDKDYILATALPRVGQLTPVVVGSSTLMLPYGRDVRNPIVNADVLDDATEMALLSGVITNYNSSANPVGGVGLDLMAKAYGLPPVDPATGGWTVNLDDALLSQVAGVISVGGVQYSSELVRGNFYSLDYLSLTPRGNGLLANLIISAINRGYKANIPAIDVNKLPTNAQ
jgi:hypothetical protein